MLLRCRNCFLPRTYTEFTQNAAHMRVDRIFCDIQHVSNLSIGVPTR
jgi:hypothetical protein